MMNGMSDTEFLFKYTNDNYRAKNEGRPANVMFKGDTQGGKTLLVQVLAILWAEAMGLPKPMPDLHAERFVRRHRLRPVRSGRDLRRPERDGPPRQPPGVVALAAQCGGILYLDEINTMGERVTSSLHPLCDSRHPFPNRGKAVCKGGVFLPEIVTAQRTCGSSARTTMAATAASAT